jgi:hypothetical protein
MGLRLTAVRRIILGTNFTDIAEARLSQRPGFFVRVI